jgi:hypothetical protein
VLARARLRLFLVAATPPPPPAPYRLPSFPSRAHSRAHPRTYPASISLTRLAQVAGPGRPGHRRGAAGRAGVDAALHAGRRALGPHAQHPPRRRRPWAADVARGAAKQPRAALAGFRRDLEAPVRVCVHHVPGPPGHDCDRDRGIMRGTLLVSLQATPESLRRGPLTRTPDWPADSDSEGVTDADWQPANLFRKSDENLNVVR